MINTLDIHRLVDLIDATDGDKPESYRLAKILKDEVDRLIKATQPGAGEFKWSAKAVKALTKPAYTKKGLPSLMVARDGAEVWYTNDHYMKRGDVPKRFGAFDEVEMSHAQMMRVIPIDGEVVTVMGQHGDLDDVLVLSNGTLVDKLLLTYAMSGCDDVLITNNGPLMPVRVESQGEVVALVMPLYPDAIAKMTARSK